MRGVPKRAWRRRVGAPAGAIDGAPLRGTKRMRGVPTRARGRIVDAPAGDIGQAPWGARKVRAVCRNWRMDTMWTHPRGPLVELSEGHETCEDHAEVGAGAKCGRTRWGYMWSSPVGRETCERCAEMGAGAPCGQGRWGHGWSSLAGHEPCARYAEMGSGAPCGRTRWGHRWSSLRCTKRVRRVPISAGTLCGRTRWGHRWSCLGGTNRVMGSKDDGSASGGHAGQIWAIFMTKIHYFLEQKVREKVLCK